MKRYAEYISRKILSTNSMNRMFSTKNSSTKQEIERRYNLFKLEQKRQRGKIGRVEKIEVNFNGVPKNCTFIMNKDISTPYDCARHISEWHSESSALAIVDKSVPWDMHRPLAENCTLQLQHFTVADPYHVNKAFWRSCSYVLGVVASLAFKDYVPVKLHSFPKPDVRSGSFVYDVDLPSLECWRPTTQELQALSAEFVKLVRLNLPFERLDVNEECALEMFRDNVHKTMQIPNIAKENGKVTLYGVGQHVDISKGPLIGRTGLIGKLAVAAVHQLSGSSDDRLRTLYRFQGVALPVGVVMNHFAFDILINRAKNLNPARSPFAAPPPAAATADSQPVWW